MSSSIPAATAASAAAAAAASSSSVSNKASSRKRRLSYTRVACEECQRRKTKCTGEQPCKVCRNSNNTCVYKRTTRFRSGDRGSDNHSDNNRNMTSSQSAAPSAITAKKAPEYAFQPAAPYHRAPYMSTSSMGYPLFPPIPDSDYYLQLAEQCLIAPEPQGQDVHGASPSPPVAGTLVLQQLIDGQNSEHSRSPLALLDSIRWRKIITAWHEEIGILYPFLDVDKLQQEIQRISRASPRAFHPTTRSSGEIKKPHRERLEDVAMLLLAIVSFLIDSDVPKIADAWVEKTYADVLTQTQLKPGVEMDDVAVLLLAVVYFFLTDRENLAWRGIGTAMRLLMEQDTQTSSGASPQSGLWDAGQVEIMFWTALTIDRRFSFGTGLPFSVSDSEIRRSPSFAANSASFAYLKHMISYCRIASDIRAWLLESASSSGSSFEFNRDLLTFRLEQWQQNLPSKLHYGGVEDVFKPESENRGEFRVRLTLYLRANQMRIIIHRKMMVREGGNGLESSTIITLATVARDSVRILVKLAQDTDIFYTQYRTFNHFLETALSSLLLALGSLQEEADKELYMNDGHAALDLIEQLCKKFPRARRLFEKFDGVREIMNQFRERNNRLSQATARPHRGSSGMMAKDSGVSPSGQAARMLVGSSRSVRTPKQSGQGHTHGRGQVGPMPGGAEHQGKQEDAPESTNYAAYPQSDDMCPSLTPDTFPSNGTFSQAYQQQPLSADAKGNAGHDFVMTGTGSGGGGFGCTIADFDAASYFPDFSLVLKPYELDFLL